MDKGCSICCFINEIKESTCYLYGFQDIFNRFRRFKGSSIGTYQNLLWQQERSHGGQLEYKRIKCSNFMKDNIIMSRKGWHHKKYPEMLTFVRSDKFFLEVFHIEEKNCQSDYFGAATKIVTRFLRVHPISWHIILVSFSFRTSSFIKVL